MKQKTKIMAFGAVIICLALFMIPYSQTGHYFSQANYSLTIKTSPTGCTVFISGIGQTISDSNGYATFSVPLGTYTVQISKTGYTTVSFDKTIIQSKTVIVVLQQLEAGRYTVTVNTNPTGCTIAIPGFTAVAITGGAQFTNVPTGSYPLTVSKTGYVSQTQTIAVSSAATLTVILSPVILTYTLTVSTNPTACAVNIGGTVKTSTSIATFSLTAGTYAVQVSKPGYYPSTQDVTITGDKTISVTLAMMTYDLIISTNPLDCNVTLTGVGTVNSGPTGKASFENLAPGTYTVTIAKTGYVTVTRTVTIGSDEILSIALSPVGQPVPPTPEQPKQDFMFIFIFIALAALIAVLIYLRKKRKK